MIALKSSLLGYIDIHGLDIFCNLNQAEIASSEPGCKHYMRDTVDL